MKNCIYCEGRVWWWQKKVSLEIRHSEGISNMHFHLKCGQDISGRSELPSIEELDGSTTEKHDD